LITWAPIKTTVKREKTTSGGVGRDREKRTVRGTRLGGEGYAGLGYNCKKKKRKRKIVGVASWKRGGPGDKTYKRLEKQG